MGLAIAGLAVAAGGAVYAASESKKAAKAAAGVQRNTGAELAEVLKSAPDVFEAGRYNDYMAGYQQLDLNRMFSDDVMELYPRLAEAERLATRQQRADDVRDIGRLGPRLQQHLDTLNPGWREAADSLSDLLSSAGDRTPLLEQMNQQALGDRTSPINSRLEDFALSELALGGELSPDEMRRVQQDSRAAASARGLYGSDAAALDEILNLDSARRARSMERAQLAQGVQSSLLAELAQDRAFAQGVEGLNQQDLAGDRSFALNNASVQQNRLAPLLSILTARTPVNPAAAAGILSSGPQTVGSSTALLSNILGYGQDVADTNYNATQARYINQANNAAAIGGAAMKAGGSMAGAAY